MSCSTTEGTSSVKYGIVLVTLESKQPGGICLTENVDETISLKKTLLRPTNLRWKCRPLDINKLVNAEINLNLMQLWTYRYI